MSRPTEGPTASARYWGECRARIVVHENYPHIDEEG